MDSIDTVTTPIPIPSGLADDPRGSPLSAADIGGTAMDVGTDSVVLLTCGLLSVLTVTSGTLRACFESDSGSINGQVGC